MSRVGPAGVKGGTGHPVRVPCAACRMHGARVLTRRPCPVVQWQVNLASFAFLFSEIIQ